MQDENKELRILRAVKLVLTNIARETATPPEMKHPLSDQTLNDIRQCLFLISEREKEFADSGHLDMSRRPQTPADSKPSNPKEQRINISSIGKKKPSDT